MLESARTLRFPPAAGRGLAVGNGSSPRPSVLLVDDDPMVRISLRHGLELTGFQVQEAENGSRAIDLLETETYDWAVTDLFMPERDGLEVMQVLRRDHRRTRIIAMSGGGLGGSAAYYLNMARLLGAEHVMEKPFAYPELAAALGSSREVQCSGPRSMRMG